MTPLISSLKQFWEFEARTEGGELFCIEAEVSKEGAQPGLHRETSLSSA